MIDNNLIFETYLRSLNEATPFAGPEDGFGAPEKIRHHRDQKGTVDASGYRIGDYSRDTGRDIVEITDNIVVAIKNEIFTRDPRVVGGVQYQLYFAGTKDELQDRVTGIIHRKLGGSKADSGYAARIVVNYILKLADVDKGRVVTKDFEGQVADAAPVIQAIQQVVDPAAVNNPAVPRAPAPPAEREYTHISVTSKYKLSEGRSRNPYVNEMYEILRLEIGEGEEVTGAKLVEILESEAVLQSEIKAVLSEMLQAGMIEKITDNADPAIILDPDDGDEDYNLDAMSRELTNMRRNIAQGRTEVPDTDE